MSFVLNLTSRAASGREIVRTRQIAGDVLTIGRDPASDIHLTDLEVTRHHAEITRTGPHSVAVRALAGLPLLVDGRSTEQGTIDAARGGEIRIGAARIAIAAGEDGAIAVSVARDSQPLIGAEEAGKRFSLAGAAIGKRPMAWTLALFILAIFLAWPIWSFTHAPAKLTDAQMTGGYKHIDQTWSSGPLSRAHAGIRDCKACHVAAFVAVPDTACQTCHTDILAHADADQQARAKPRPDGIAGLKLAIADMFGRDPGRCVDCHAEHSGPGAMPAVAETQCAACHADMKSKLPDTKLGDAGDFAGLHPQFQPAVMTTPGDYPRFTRVSLTNPPNVQDSGLKFPHALHLSRLSGVARMQASLGRKPLDCAECHIPDDSGARFKPVSMERNCSQCHSLAFDQVGGTVRTLRHGNAAQVIADILAAGGGGVSSSPAGGQRPGEIRAAPGRGGAGGGGAAMVRAIFSPKGACYDCHVIVPPSSPGGLNYRVVPVREQLRFIRKGWFDHAAHTTTSCASCHSQALTTNDSRILMLPGISTCRQCHGGDTAKAPQVRSTCAMCHDYHRGNGAPHAVRMGKLAAKGGGGDADRANLGPAPGIRPRRPGGNERAPP